MQTRSHISISVQLRLFGDRTARSTHIPDDVAMLEGLNERHLFLYVLVFALGFLHVLNVQLDHLHRYQLAGVRQPAPNLPPAIFWS